MATEMKKCAHKPCTCTVTEGKYCSQVCEDATDVTTLGCDCGHAGCGGQAI